MTISIFTRVRVGKGAGWFPPVGPHTTDLDTRPVSRPVGAPAAPRGCGGCTVPGGHDPRRPGTTHRTHSLAWSVPGQGGARGHVLSPPVGPVSVVHAGARRRDRLTPVAGPAPTKPPT